MILSSFLVDEILQLDAYKAGLKLERDEAMAGEMRDLRSSLAALEEEKSRQIQEIQDMQEKSKLSNVNIELLEEGINQKNKVSIRNFSDYNVGLHSYSFNVTSAEAFLETWNSVNYIVCDSENTLLVCDVLSL